MAKSSKQKIQTEKFEANDARWWKFNGLELYFK